MMRYEYAIRRHARLVESDPELATVMYGINGIWWDMATGHPDHIEDIVEALEWREEVRSAEREAEVARLLAEIEEADRG
jgi:lysophospholipase L1-like esterase